MAFPLVARRTFHLPAEPHRSIPGSPLHDAQRSGFSFQGADHCHSKSSLVIGAGLRALHLLRQRTARSLAKECTEQND